MQPGNNDNRVNDPLLRQRRNRRPKRCQLRFEVGFVRADEAFDVSRSQLASVDQGRFQGAHAGSHLRQAIHNFQQDRFHAENDTRRNRVGAPGSRPFFGR